MMIASKDELEGKKYDLKEQWYGTEYTIVPLSDKLLKVRFLVALRFGSVANLIQSSQSTDTKEDYSDLALPKPNSFIPTNLEIQNKIEVTEVRPLTSHSFHTTDGPFHSSPNDRSACKIRLSLDYGTKRTTDGGFLERAPSSSSDHLSSTTPLLTRSNPASSPN